MVSSDGTGIVSQPGGVLLTRTLRATGLDRCLVTALRCCWGAPAVHSPGKILIDRRSRDAGGLPANVSVLEPEPPGPVAFDPVSLPAGGRLAARGGRGRPGPSARRRPPWQQAWGRKERLHPGARSCSSPTLTSTVQRLYRQHQRRPAAQDIRVNFPLRR